MLHPQIRPFSEGAVSSADWGSVPSQEVHSLRPHSGSGTSLRERGNCGVEQALKDARHPSPQGRVKTLPYRDLHPPRAAPRETEHRLRRNSQSAIGLIKSASWVGVTAPDPEGNIYVCSVKQRRGFRKMDRLPPPYTTVLYHSSIMLQNCKAYFL